LPEFYVKILYPYLKSTFRLSNCRISLTFATLSTYMNTEQKKIIAKSFLFIIVFFVSAIFIYYTIFAQFVPTSYSYTVIDVTNKTNVTTNIDSATDLYERIFIVVSGIIGCALGVVSTKIIK